MGEICPIYKKLLKIVEKEQWLEKGEENKIRTLEAFTKVILAILSLNYSKEHAIVIGNSIAEEFTGTLRDLLNEADKIVEEVNSEEDETLH